MFHTLMLTDDEREGQEPGVADLLTYLAASGETKVTLCATPDRLRRLDGIDAVLARVTRAPLSDEQESALISFVERGGGLLLLGETGETWRSNVRLRAMLGLPQLEYARRGPVAELIALVAGENDMTRRLDASFAIEEAPLLLDATPDDAQLALVASWRYTTIPLAFARRVGAGCVFYTSLSVAAATLSHTAMRQLVYRALRVVTGWVEPRPIRVASLGYGAIGREHAEAIQATPGLEYVSVCDRNPTRLDEALAAFPGVRVTTDSAELFRDDTVDTVIVGTPPNTHAALALQALQAGKHVVVEKPFCMTTAEADLLIETAQAHGRMLTVYQNRRWDPDYLALTEAVRSGAIGDIFHVETFIGSFSHPCDFWHSHEPISGGVFYDWGSHYLDWILTLLPDAVSDVRASAHKRVWHDVTNADQATLTIRFAGGQEATFIHSDVAALLKPKWYMLGTRGALRADWRYETITTRKWTGDLIEEPLAPSESLPVLTLATRGSAGQIHEQRLSLPPAPRHPFHRNLAGRLLAGEPLAVAPEKSRRNIAVMEAAVYSAAHDAAVVPIAARYA